MRSKISVLRVVGALEALAFFSTATQVVRANTVEVYTVSTVAGAPGVAGNANGTTSDARFSYAYGVAVDHSGNIYIADTFNHTIRKMANGQVSTFAGTAGLSGSSDGPGNAARFSGPYGIAIDANDNLYIADTNNHTIRKITPAGVVNTLAGSAGNSGSNDGIGAAARFYSPNAVTTDASGYVYVADTTNNTIRKIAPNGTVTTLAGAAGIAGSADGTGSQARFNFPCGVVADAAGNLYVADTNNSTIRTVTASGVVSTLAGSASATGSTDGAGTAARFRNPRGVALDAKGNLYLADEFNGTLRKITAGTVSTIAGLAGASGSSDGGGSAARFNRVTGVAVDSSGFVYASDTYNFTIRSATSSVVKVPPPLVDGVLDRSFNPGEFTNGDVRSAAWQSDGRLVIAGYFNKVHGVVRHGIARLNADGTLDTGFGVGAGPDSDPNGVVLQNDGKPIIFGNFAHVDSVSRAAGLARLNTDGSLDVRFDPGRGISNDATSDANGTPVNSGSVLSVLLEPNGKLLVFGYFNYVIVAPGQAIPCKGIARFNADGSFDSSFNPGGSADGPVISGVRQSTGKIVLQGGFSTYDNHPVAGLVRVNNDGTYDASFDPGTGADDFVDGLFNQSGDHLIIFGYFSSFNETPCSGIVRLTDSGAVDSTFAPEAFHEYNNAHEIYALAEQPNGKLLVGGLFHSSGSAVANGLVRLDANGARDPSLDTSGGIGPSGVRVSAITVRPDDGHIFVGGYFSTFDGEPRNNMAWIGPDGSLDPTFAGLKGAMDYNPQVYAIAIQPDGKVLVGGAFTSYDGAPHNNLVRLNGDGTLDPSFDPNFGTDGSVRAIRVQADGKILIAGVIRGVNGVARGGIARVNSDGMLDTTFDPGLGADYPVYSFDQDAAGNIYIGGVFEHFNATPRARLAKLTPNGALDMTFNPGLGPDSTVYAVALAPYESYIVVGGSFTSYNTVPARRIVSVNTSSGGGNPGFNYNGTGTNGTVRTIVRSSNGRLSVGGTFSSYNGISTGRVLRIFYDGSLDPSFFAPSNVTSAASLAFQGNKLIVGALSNAAGATPVRLTETGAVDPSFGSGAGATVTPASAYVLVSILGNYFPAASGVSAIAVQNDGKPIIGGIFNQYDGTPRVALARLTDPSLAFGAESIKTHSTSGSFEIGLPPNGAPGVECRGASSHRIVITAAGPLTLPGAAVTSGTGTVTGFSVSGNTATVDLSGVANAQTLGLTLLGISTGTSTADVTLRASFLLGDSNGDGMVNSADATQTRNRSGQTADPATFRSDLNLDGAINSADATIARARSGTGLSQVHSAVSLLRE